MSIANKKPTKRELSALETKNKLFRTALMLFSKYGYEKVTIENITDHAKVSKGNFYNHFDSKDGVLVEQFHRIDSHYINVFNNISKDDNASNKLRALIGAMCDYCKNTCGVNAIQVIYANQVSSNKHSKILDNKNRPFYTFIRETVAQGQNNGEFRCDIELEKMVELIARYCRALLYDWCLYNDSFDLQIEGNNYTDFILSSIRPK